MGGAGVNEYVHCTIMAHIIMYARRSAPLCTDVGVAYGGLWGSDCVRVT